PGCHGDPQGSRQREPPVTAAKADALVIGGGHNGLVAAALLAKGGVSTLVLERRDDVGGAAITEELCPGFRVSTLAHTAGPLPASVVKDLGLSLELIKPEPRLFAPLRDGRGLVLWGDARKSAGEVGKLSTRDGARYPEFDRSLRRVSAVLARVLEMTPP